MSNKRILVTGANGAIGKHVIPSLLDAGFEVIATDRSFSKNSHPCCTTVVCDLFTEGVLERLLSYGIPDICLHLAWRNGFNHNDVSHILDLPKHFQFLKELTESGVGQIAVMGSMHEVGYWEGVVTSETSCNPSNYYAIAKNSLRQMLSVLALQKKVIFQWLRAYYIINPDPTSPSIFGKLVKASNEGQTLFPFTSGENKFDFIEVDALAHQITACISQVEYQGIINCCSGVPMSLGSCIESFIDAYHLDVKLEYGAYPNRPTESPAIWGDACTIKKIVESYENRIG